MADIRENLKLRRWVSVVLAVAAIWIGYILTTGGDPASRRSDERRRGAVEFERSAPAGRTDPRPVGFVEVIVPDRRRGYVPVAVADEEKILYVRRVPVNEPTSIREMLPKGRKVIIAVIDDFGRSPYLSSLHARYVWPSPVAVTSTNWPRDVELRFKLPTDHWKIEISARTSGGKAAAKSVFRISGLHDATSAAFPIAFLQIGPEGTAFSPLLADGRYRVSLQSASDLLRLTSTARLTIQLHGKSEHASFVFQDVGSLTGLVRGEPNRKFAVDVYEHPITASPFVRSLHTDQNGAVTLDALPPGDYVAVSWPHGYMEASAEFSVSEGRATHFVLSPKRGGSVVRVRLLDHENRPLRAGMNINRPLRPGVRPSGRPFGTDEDGIVLCLGVGSGERVAIIWDQGYLRRFVVDHHSGEIDLGTLRVPQLRGGATVSGNVSDDGGTPLRGTLVCLQRVGNEKGWARFARTDGVGDYQLEHVSPGRYMMWHEPTPAANFVAYQHPVEVVVRAEDARFDLRLPRP